MKSARATPSRALGNCRPDVLLWVAIAAFLGLSAPARADLRAGVAAYQSGDYAAALAELAPLAKKGDGEAQYYLGSMYEGGLGVPPDAARALALFRKAAEQGVVQAAYHLGLLYEIGETVARDYARAAEWYRRAAERGYAPAQNNLGSLYMRGLGVESDPIEAYFWISLALEQDYPDARVNHTKVSALLSSTVRSRIDARVKTWTPKAP